MATSILVPLIAIGAGLAVLSPGGQSCSAGLACWNGEESSDELLGRADAALYEAKQGGRDRTVLA